MSSGTAEVLTWSLSLLLFSHPAVVFVSHSVMLPFPLWSRSYPLLPLLISPLHSFLLSLPCPPPRTWTSQVSCPCRWFFSDLVAPLSLNPHSLSSPHSIPSSRFHPYLLRPSWSPPLIPLYLLLHLSFPPGSLIPIPSSLSPIILLSHSPFSLFSVGSSSLSYLPSLFLSLNLTCYLSPTHPTSLSLSLSLGWICGSGYEWWMHTSDYHLMLSSWLITPWLYSNIMSGCYFAVQSDL